MKPTKTAKNIVIFINNNAFIYSLTSSIEPGGTEPSTARNNNKGMSEYKDRSYVVTRHRRVVVVSLISHPYGD